MSATVIILPIVMPERYGDPAWRVQKRREQRGQDAIRAGAVVVGRPTLRVDNTARPVAPDARRA